MDSLTQLALGAAVGKASLGKKLGRASLGWGALCGTIPDLDVFVPLGDPVSDFTYHRSASHSLFMLALLTPLLVWLIKRLHPAVEGRKDLVRAYILVYGAFATHVLLDSFTVYGTQIFWPFDTTPASWSSLFIIDPLYTLPLLIGVGWSLLSPHSATSKRLNLAGLCLSTLYIGWSYAAKVFVEAKVEAALSERQIQYDKLLSTPAPLTTLLWRLVARTNGGYYEIYYSLLSDNKNSLDVHFYSSRDDLRPYLRDNEAAQRLMWFTDGFYKIYEKDAQIIIADTRMGIEPDYVFQFAVAAMPLSQSSQSMQNQASKHSEPRPPHTIVPTRIPSPPNVDRLVELFQRILPSAGTQTD